MDLNIYKIDLDTDQPNGGKGESPRSAFTKYNNSLDTISDELTTLDDSAMKKADNLSGLTDASTARNNLGLGNAATRDVGTVSGTVAAGNDTRIVNAVQGAGMFIVNFSDVYIPNGFYRWSPSTLNFPAGLEDYGTVIATGAPTGDSSSNHRSRILVGLNSDRIYFQRSVNRLPWTAMREMLHTGNTTIDGNGFIKIASPIVKLFSDFIEKTEHLEIAEAELERLGVGHYVLHNVPSLSKDGWYIETPKDKNNNIYFYLDYVKDEDNNTLTIKTYEPDYSSGRAEAGAPMDIIDGRFVSLRFEEDLSLYPELEEPKTEEE